MKQRCDCVALKPIVFEAMKQFWHLETLLFEAMKQL
jgi:hypothetical protein